MVLMLIGNLLAMYYTFKRVNISIDTCCRRVEAVLKQVPLCFAIYSTVVAFAFVPTDLARRFPANEQLMKYDALNKTTMLT